MFTLPYHTLIHFKRWATDGLYGVVGQSLDRLPAEDRTIVLRLLDHTQAVDEIFRRNLEGRPHGHRAPRSAEIPAFDVLASRARATGQWYADYVDALAPGHVDETVDFSFSSGEDARMTRGEMLLHVAMHSAGHRAQVALLLQKNGTQPFPDRITDFLAAEATATKRRASR